MLAAAIINAIVASPALAQPTQAAIIGAEWLGPQPAERVATQLRRPIWQGPGAMFVEQQEAVQTIRSWWPASIADPKAAAIIDGFAWYLQTHATERAFDLRYLRTAHSVETRAYFGDHLIWSLPPLRLSRQAAAAGNRFAAVFLSLERWIGVANLQAAMFEVAHLPPDQLKAEAIVKTISDSAGQDLSWAFDAAAMDINYAIDAMSDRSVTVARRDAGIFPGRTAPRVGDFDSGDAVRVKVVFADRTTSLMTWDGRDQMRTFTFQGPSTVVAAYLDPDRIITLDRNRLDNAIVPPSTTNVPILKWSARWMVWLQHTMLSYGFLA